MRVMVWMLMMVLAAGAQAGEIYRWVDDKGKVHYGDQPAPTSKQPTRVVGKPNVMEVDKESYSLRRAREQAPVTLYITECGPVCDRTREHLKQRGVPHASKDPTKAPEIAVELKKLTGSYELPVLQVGAKFEKGFEPTAWDALLEGAGYPLKPLPVADKP